MSRPNPPPTIPNISEFDMMSRNNPIRSLDASESTIGKPVAFTSGQFAGRTLRAELIELQKADLGRKYARKDRRPLDPPPVCQLKLYDVFDAGTSRETHQEFEDYDDIRGVGLLCHIDLFPVPEQENAERPHTETGRRPRQPRHQARLNEPASFPTASTATSSATASSSGTASTSSTPWPFTFTTGLSSYSLPPPPPPPPPPLTSLLSSPSGPLTLPPISQFASGSSRPYTLPPPSLPPGHGISLPPMQVLEHRRQSVFTLPNPNPYASQQAYPPAPLSRSPPQPPQASDNSNSGRPVLAGPGAPPGVVAYLGDYPITENSKCTDSLAGAKFAQAANLEFKGKKVLMFVFSDIAVKIEGTFILRYRVFNLFASVEGDWDIPVLAEIYGGPFKIYSTKEFPGLRASTDLTKHLSYFGVRLNLRENERKRRRAGHSGEASGSHAGKSGSPMSVSSGSSRGRGRGGRHQGRGGDSEEEGSSQDEDD